MTNDPALEKQDTASDSRRMWFDVGDLVQYFAHAPFPSGIQRVVLETISAARLQTLPFGLCRITSDGTVIALPDEWLDLVQHPPIRARSPEPVVRHKPRAPMSLSRRDLFAKGFRQLAKGGATLSRALLPAGLTSRLKQFANSRFRRSVGIHAWERALEVMGQPVHLTQNDMLVALGSPWATPGYEQAAAKALDANGARYGFLFYDLIPISHPHFFPAGPNPFASWLRWSTRRACYAQAISQYSAHALDTYREAIKASPFPIDVIRLGDSFKVTQATVPLPPGLEDKPYVLCVGTIEPRKNHRLLFDAWLLLRAKLGAACPRLVWVGHKGELIDDLFTQLDACNWMDGLVVHLPRVSDDELTILYRQAWLTVFPSHVEGWGLPVGESLAHGKVCLAAQASSLPEVGGDLAMYLNPHDACSLVALIEQLHEDSAAVRAREELIRSTWKPTPWNDCAQQVLSGFQRALLRSDALPSRPTQRHQAAS